MSLDAALDAALSQAATRDPHQPWAQRWQEVAP